MKLEDYVYESWSPDRPGNPFPGTLEIPGYLIQDFRELYKLTESRGRECGYILFYEGKSWPIRHDLVASGNPTNMNIPKSHSYYNFGNVHAHPSGSIGHSGGYSAHSVLDLLTFGDTTDRKLFIQFVVSGPKLYAMLFRAGWSTFGDAVRGFVKNKNDQISAEANEYVIRKNFRTEDEFREKVESCPDQIHVDLFFNDLKRRTVGFGKKMEELSVSSCKEFARRFGYGFYIGKTEGFGTGNLHRQ